MEEALPFDEPRPVRLTVEDFLLLAASGALDRYRRTELIEGVIVEMSPMQPRHARLAGELYFRLRLALEAGGSLLEVLPGPTVKLPPHDAPEPDLVVVRRTDDRWIPGEATLLAIEVAFATLRRDLSTKRDLYARGGVRELSVVDGEAGEVHQFWAPIDGVYRESRVVPLGGELRSATMPELAIEMAA